MIARGDYVVPTVASGPEQASACRTGSSCFSRGSRSRGWARSDPARDAPRPAARDPACGSAFPRTTQPVGAASLFSPVHGRAVRARREIDIPLLLITASVSTSSSVLRRCSAFSMVRLPGLRVGVLKGIAPLFFGAPVLSGLRHPVRFSLLAPRVSLGFASLAPRASGSFLRGDWRSGRAPAELTRSSPIERRSGPSRALGPRPLSGFARKALPWRSPLALTREGGAFAAISRDGYSCFAGARSSG